MDKWDKLAGELNKMENLNHYSIISFWKDRLQEETELFKRKIMFLNDEVVKLREMLDRYAHDAKSTYHRLTETEKRYDFERTVLEEKLKTKESELKYEQSQVEQCKKMITLLQTGQVQQTQALMPAQIPVPGPASIGGSDILESVVAEKNRLKQELQILREQQGSLKASGDESSELKKKVAELEDKNLQGDISGNIKHKLAFFKQLEEAHLLDLENLARGFAHKVRNYLGIISGTAQMLVSRSRMNDEDKEQIDLIEQNAMEMLVSIEEFLSLAKIPELNFKPISLNELVYTISLVLEDQLKNQGIDIKKTLDQSLPNVQVDERLMGEAFQAILNNAAESMKSGGSITIETKFNKEQNVVSVKVIDKGKGISDNHMKKIYQPYFSTKKGHKGLGLTMGRRVAELHHGLLNIESKKDEGTTVSLVLPVKQD